jgi:hypothetical protein
MRVYRVRWKNPRLARFRVDGMQIKTTPASYTGVVLVVRVAARLLPGQLRKYPAQAEEKYKGNAHEPQHYAATRVKN